MNKEIESLIQQMTLEEKASLCSGQDFWNLKSIQRLNIPSIMVTDGPHGLRKQIATGDQLGLFDSIPATCYPTAVGLASTWDKDLIKEVGVHLGIEAQSEKVSVILGPGANIKRNPLCGRNFEYFSEDPYLTGQMAASLIKGIQSKNIGTSLKHYLANNQESNRMVSNAEIDLRTLREIYLKGFEIAVKASQPWTVMCSYNKVNGEYVSDSKLFLNDILKEEWKHQGLVVTDWGAANDRVLGLKGGLELQMPGSGGVNDQEIVEAVKNNTLDEKVLDERVARILELIKKSEKTLNEKPQTYDQNLHHEFARKVSAETIVLLKNEDHILPLSAQGKIALIGDFAKTPRYQGSGSSLIVPTKLDTAYDAFKSRLGDRLLYAKGYDANSNQISYELINEAVQVAKQAKIVVVMAGLINLYESEGFDRSDLKMTPSHDVLISEIIKVNPNVIVILANGAPVLMPWKEDVKAILEQYLGGQASGSALADIIFGDVNPSAKLAETFPNSEDEFPSSQNFPGLPKQVEYREGLYVGYRFYETAQVKPLFPFGFGLSYTEFKYDNLSISTHELLKNQELMINAEITNTGDLFGKEIVQLYIRHLNPSIYKPLKELKDFVKLSINPHEVVSAEFTLPYLAFAFYDVKSKDWIVEAGEYEILLGSSVEDIRLRQSIVVQGENLEKEALSVYDRIDLSFKPTQGDFEKLLGRNVCPYPPMKPYHQNSTLNEISHTFFGNILKKTIVKQFKKQMTQGNDTAEKMMEQMLGELPFRNLQRMSEGKVSKDLSDGLLYLVNGRIFKGLKKIIFKK